MKVWTEHCGKSREEGVHLGDSEAKEERLLGCGWGMVRFRFIAWDSG